MVFLCVVGMLLCVALAARAEERRAATPDPDVISWPAAAAIVAAPVAWVAAYENAPRTHALDLHAYEWDRLAPDKRLHAEVSARIGFAVAAFVFAAPELTTGSRIAAAAVGCLSVGIGKEALDAAAGLPSTSAWPTPERSPTPKDQAGDLAADFAGCAAGVATGAAFGSGLRISVVSIAGSHVAQVGVQVPF